MACLLGPASLLLAATALAQAPPPSVDTELQTVIVSVTPVQGTGVPMNQVPSPVHVLRAAEIATDHLQTLSDEMARHFGGDTLSDTEGNPFQQDLMARGFTASPVLGTPQGLAMYQNGARINEAFGDVVLWDLVPIFAIAEVQQLTGTNPVYGLNALGGAVAIQMKDGFAYQGTAAELSGGSFDRYRATVQSGAASGAQAFYAGAMVSHDGGWRALSDSDVLQAFADAAWRGDDYRIGSSLSLAWNRLNGNGANPAQDDPRAAFAVPDLERNHMIFLQMRADSTWSEHLSLHGNAYLRDTHIEIQNGAASGFGPCGQGVCNDSAPLTLLDGNPVSASAPYSGILPDQTTHTLAVGGAVQLSTDAPLGGWPNHANVGASYDLGDTRFRNVTYLGSLIYLNPAGTITVPDGQLLGGSAYNDRLDAINRYGGAFLTDTLTLSDSATVTVAGRLNLARLELQDRFGNALSGNHDYGRLNPSIGVTDQLTANINLFANYSEANRIPTAAELSCANPAIPCTFPLAFVSDPGLHQVVARSGEIGARGSAHGSGPDSPKLAWSADAFMIRNSDDILFVSAGPLLGSGYFRNAGSTRRVGAELSADGSWRQFDVHASYALIRATFQSGQTILSANNPGADGNGNISVRPGDHLPEVPMNTAKVGAGIAISERLHLSVDAAAVSSRYLRGDEANLQAPLPGYVVVDALLSWQAGRDVSLFLRGENLLDRRYASFGLYGDPTGNGAFPQFTNPRFYVPGQPFGLWAGIRVAW